MCNVNYVPCVVEQNIGLAVKQATPTSVSANSQYVSKITSLVSPLQKSFQTKRVEDTRCQKIPLHLTINAVLSYKASPYFTIVLRDGCLARFVSHGYSAQLS